MPVPKFNPMEGTVVGANVLFVDEVGVPTDPTTVIITFRAPDGTLLTPVVTNLGVGLYRAEVVVNAGGLWVVQAEGTGALVIIEEAQFEVRSKVI